MESHHRFLRFKSCVVVLLRVCGVDGGSAVRSLFIIIEVEINGLCLSRPLSQIFFRSIHIQISIHDVILRLIKTITRVIVITIRNRVVTKGDRVNLHVAGFYGYSEVAMVTMVEEFLFPLGEGILLEKGMAGVNETLRNLHAGQIGHEVLQASKSTAGVSRRVDYELTCGHRVRRDGSHADQVFPQLRIQLEDVAEGHALCLGAVGEEAIRNATEEIVTVRQTAKSQAAQDFLRITDPLQEELIHTGKRQNERLLQVQVQPLAKSPL